MKEGPCFPKAQPSFLMDISSSPRKLSSLLCSLSDLGLLSDVRVFLFLKKKKKIAFIKLAEVWLPFS